MPADTALVGRDAEREPAAGGPRGRGRRRAACAGDPRRPRGREDPAARRGGRRRGGASAPAGFRLIRVAGHEAESEIPYAALSLLLGPLLDGLGALPRPQAAALEGALNLGPGGTGDRLAVAVATLGLLAQAAEERPLLLGVDDAHCLDLPTLEALVFAVRRMRAEPIAVLVTARSPADTSPAVERWLAGLPELVVGGLDLDAARRLARPARVAVPRDLGGHRRQPAGPARAAGGRRAGAAGRAGPAQHPAGARLRAPPRRAARGHPRGPAARRGGGQRRRRRRRGAGRAGAGRGGPGAGRGGGPARPRRPGRAATDRGPGSGPRFRHPLIRSAVYHAAAPARKRAAHRALAAVHGRREGPAPAERRAFHLAAATPGADEEVAAQLAAAARSAAARNNHVTALALLERAARLSPTGPARTRRLLEAALTAQTAGSVADATPLLDLALLETDDPELITAARHLQCRVQMWSGQPTEARDELLHLADRTAGRRPRPRGRDAQPGRAAEPHDRRPAPRPRGGGPGGRRGARTCRPRSGCRSRSSTRWPWRSPATATGARALLAACEPALAAADPLTIDQLPVVAANTYASVEEPEQARRWLETGVRSTRAAGAVGLLPFLLTWLAGACWRDGDWATGLTHAHAAVELAQETGWATEEPEALAVLATIEAGLGMDDACREHAARALRLGPASGIHIVEARAERALGLLELGAGRPEAAAGHLRVTGEFALAHGLGSPVLLDWAGDLAEAYARAGMPGAGPARPGRAGAGGRRARPARGPRRRPALHRPAAGRRRGGGRRLHRGAALARARPPAVRGGAHPAVPRRAPAQAAPARRRPRGARRRAPRLRPPRRDRVGAARRERAAGRRHPDARAPAAGGAARRAPTADLRPGGPRPGAAAAHPAGAAGRARRRRRGHERRGGRPAVPVPEDDRVPPVERLPQARHPLPRRARPGRAERPGGGRRPEARVRRWRSTWKYFARSAGAMFAELRSKMSPVRSSARATSPEQTNWPSMKNVSLLPVSIDSAVLTVDSRL